MSSLPSLLRDDPPSAVAALPAERQDELAALLEQALRRQRAELEASFDTALKQVPFPLRPVVRKVLAG